MDLGCAAGVRGGVVFGGGLCRRGSRRGQLWGPGGGWTYIYTGDQCLTPFAACLDGKWNHNDAAAGGVTGTWEVAEIGVAQPSNGADQLYVAVQDSAGKVKVVNHPDPAATTLASWQQWRIPLSDLAGVNLAAVKKLSVGVGDRANPKAGGAGRLYLDDIGFGRPASVPQANP